jgi:hypothetical protein
MLSIYQIKINESLIKLFNKSLNRFKRYPNIDLLIFKIRAICLKF